VPTCAVYILAYGAVLSWSWPWAAIMVALPNAGDCSASSTGRSRALRFTRPWGNSRNHGLRAGRFRVPQPLAYVAEYHLLLLTWAEGELLRSVFLARSNAAPEIAVAAEWLLGLHQCSVRTGRRYSFLGHLQTLADGRSC
jgi:hypothetical protein